MRTCLALIALLGACDLQPPPPTKKAPPSQAQPTDLPPPPPSPPVDNAVQPPPTPTPPTPPAPAKAEPDVTAACTDVAVKIAAQLLAEAQDPAQKAALTQDRDRIVRRTAEACTRDNWPEKARDCFLKATSTADMQACGKDLAAPRED